MLPSAYSWAAQVGAVLSGGATLATMTVSARAWKRQRNPIDLAYTVGTAGWLLYLLASSISVVAPTNSWAVFATHASYQILVIGVTYFLLVSASVTRFSIHSVWMAQGLGGLLLLLAWNVWGSQEPDLAYKLWVLLNLACASALSLYLGLNVYRRRTYRCWLVFGGSLLGLGICFEDLLAAAHLRPGTTLAQYFYAAFLLLVWLLITNRVGRPEPAAVPGMDRTNSTWENVTGFFPETDQSGLAVIQERRRIAQDLHDGVGSQLVNILATLDVRAPQQQAVALALEQCLVDLKFMVDSIDGSEESVVEALGQLRYRVQHALDKLGIRMIWTVDVDGPLQDFHGERAQQVLRITQECLSNIMRHAGATVVEVVCRYLHDSDSMLLEVRDNGCGIASREAGRPTGKGLQGMQHRARKLGGYLQISTKSRVGTRVRLLVPLRAHEAAG